MSQTSADMLYSLEWSINSTIDQSEIVRMAKKHFDEESAKRMIQELKEEIKSNLESEIFESDEEE